MQLKDWSFAENSEIACRAKALAVLVKRVMNEEEVSLFVSDEANVFDISSEDDEILVGRIRKHFSITVDGEYLRRPLWQLLDYLIAGSKQFTSAVEEYEDQSSH